MKKLLCSLFSCALLFNFSCSNMNNNTNPLLSPFTAPHGAAPFDRIKTDDFEPAITKAIELHESEIDAIARQTDAPTYENTIEAMELSGSTLSRITSIFFNLLSANGDDEMIAVSERVSPMLTEHSNNINLNETLFKRVKAVYEQRDSLSLSAEEMRLLTETYNGMARSGANLESEARDRYREVSRELSQLSLKFESNLLKATNAFEMILTSPDEVKGLPQSALDAAAMRAQEKGHENAYLFDLSYPSLSAFLKYAERRDLREKIYMAYNTRCVGGEYDNRDIVVRIVELRNEAAHLLGYKNYAEYVLEHRMAQNSERVYTLLNQLLDAYKPVAEKEIRQLQAFAEKKEGHPVELMPWDYSYYSTQQKNELYDLNDEMLKPYFELEQVKKGVFGLATRLYGLTFKKTTEIPVYHKEVETFEVYDENNNYLGLLYTDFYPRPTKQGGAWMTSFKDQWISCDGTNSRPHISLVMNFTRPTASAPALLTYDEVETFLHEFGHALHGLMTNVQYESLSGTNVYRDFVELPSQLMENWLPRQEFLATFAHHYLTGEVLPDSLTQKIRDTQRYHVAYQCVRQLTYGLLDMAWHTTDARVDDITAFERNATASTQLLPAIDGTLFSAQFSHIFGGGYAAGYYGYKWAEVLDADAFSLFQEKGIFDRETAASFRKNILEKGDTEDPMSLYVRFRGREPQIDALMQRDGIK